VSQFLGTHTLADSRPLASIGRMRSAVPCTIEHTIPEPSRYTLFHQGTGQMLDHMLVTRNVLAHYRGSEIHNELLYDESAAFAVDLKYPRDPPGTARPASASFSSGF
jgi:hypothetical protein